MNIETLDLLREALPYIQRFQGKTFVVKFSGKVTENKENLASLVEELALLHQVGIKVCVVHGGGKQLNELAEKLGVVQTVIAGRRVTDDETLELSDTLTVEEKINEPTRTFTAPDSETQIDYKTDFKTLPIEVLSEKPQNENLDKSENIYDENALKPSRMRFSLCPSSERLKIAIVWKNFSAEAEWARFIWLWTRRSKERSPSNCCRANSRRTRRGSIAFFRKQRRLPR